MLLFIAIIVSTLSAQELSKQEIKNSNDYYWGEATSENEQEASDLALANLTKQIAVRVSSNFKNKVTEADGNIEENTENLLKTYSSATLTNVKTISNLVGGEIETFHYIEKSEVNKIFNDRKKLIENLYNEALQSEKDAYFKDAIMYYYYSLVLMNSIPETNFLYQSTNLAVDIPKRINAIINGTKFCLISDEKTSDKERELILQVTTFDKPVNNIDFKFWDGTKQIDVRASDGEGILQLVGSSVSFNELKVSIKYDYYECRDQLREVGEIWQLVNKPSFANSKNVKLVLGENSTAGKSTPPENNNYESLTIPDNDYKISLNKTEECPVVEKIGKQALLLINAIEKRNMSVIKQLTNGDEFLYKKITDLIKYNDFIIIGDEQYANINKTYEGWELRKIKVLNRYSSINEQSKEYIVLDFDEQGNLYDMTFGIMDGLYDEFVEQANYAGDWANRQVIIKFMEKYRTAYLGRNLAMLDSIFADEAVIIVGRVLKKNLNKDVSKYANQVPDVEYTRYTKRDYLKQQERVFRSYKDIYLGFSDFKIRRKNKAPSFYGISMRQKYHATRYADEGYLFLLVDFPDGEQPQIYVRSWQPQEWNMNELIDTGFFNINQ